jgi:hypothetical protein
LLPSLIDSWLSGFTTAEGSFFVSVLKQKYKKEVLDSEGNLGIKETISQLALAQSYQICFRPEGGIYIIAH